MGVNGKSKGNSFERSIANLLSEHVAEFTGIEKALRRNPDSGSFFGGSNTHRTEVYDTEFATYGDLICPRNFRFSVECKHYKDAPPLNAIAKQKVSDWDKWISQSDQDAANSQKESLLIVKYNRTETLAFLTFIVDDVNPVIYYQDRYVYSLDDLLKLPAEFFFV